MTLFCFTDIMTDTCHRCSLLHSLTFSLGRKSEAAGSSLAFLLVPLQPLRSLFQHREPCFRELLTAPQSDGTLPTTEIKDVLPNS
jgi:hypothetical protein